MEPQTDELLLGLGVAELPDYLARRHRSRWDDTLQVGLARLRRNGDFSRYFGALRPIASCTPANVELNSAAPTVELTQSPRGPIQAALEAVGPWKKGPFHFQTAEGLIELDAEWRSDRKWTRLASLFDDFSDQRVLDVGTGNGYFLYRLMGAGARCVLGLDPGLLSVCQFLLLQRFFQVKDCALLPVTCEEFLTDSACYDIVLSMGVLYHRRSPLDHLIQLRSFLRPGGTLVLETLAYPGGPGMSFLPPGRYAQMRNVFFLPSPDTLQSWLEKTGFELVSRSSLDATSVTEQRSTAWMPHPSLDSFLQATSADPDAHDRRTSEGHLRPHRVIMIAKSKSP